MFFRRFWFGVVAYNGRVFAVGGRETTRHVVSVEASDPDTSTWHPMPPMLNPRCKFGIAVMDDRLYVVGGSKYYTNISDVECFDAKTGTWSEVCNLTVQRHGLCCSAVHCPTEAIETLVSCTSPPTPEGVTTEIDR